MRSSSMGCNRVAPLPSEMGGWLFTWGGDFTWQQRGKRDHHEGCLGLGDLSGRLVPTMVKGEDDIKQVGHLRLYSFLTLLVKARMLQVIGQQSFTL